mgnify:CR=1 FL=1
MGNAYLIKYLDSVSFPIISFDEIKRIVIALQKADSDGVATPADWRPGDDVIIPTAGSCGTAKERMESKDDNMYCLDWFMCFKKEK